MLKKKQERELYGAPLKKRMQSEKRETPSNLENEEVKDENKKKDEGNQSDGEPTEVLGFGGMMRVDVLKGKAKARLRKKLNK